MPSPFRVEVTSRGAASVLRVAGELDLATSPALEQELERLIAADASLIVVDLGELEFMDSTGLSVLVRAHQRAEENGYRLGLVAIPHQVQRLLTLTGVTDRLVLEQVPELGDA